MALKLNSRWTDSFGVTKTYRDWVINLGGSDRVEHAIANGNLEEAVSLEDSPDSPPYT